MSTAVPTSAYTGNVAGSIKAAWFVAPGSRGATYKVTVDVNDGRPVSCECRDFQYRGTQRPCKHIVAASQPDHSGYRLHFRYGPRDAPRVGTFSTVHVPTAADLLYA